MRKICGWLLALVMLCMPVLGLADGIDKLPDTFAELCEMLPDMPTEDPENFAVSFPVMGDNGMSNLEIYCDKTEWQAATGRVDFSGLKFAYDEKLGAYVLDEYSQTMYETMSVSGGLTGYIATAAQDENGWIKNVAIYFDNEAMVQVCWGDSPDEWNWGHVKDDSATNYMMIGIRSRKNFDSGVFEVWRYADRTEVIRYDADGKVEVEKKTYPEYSEFCKAFKPLVPAE